MSTPLAIWLHHIPSSGFGREVWRGIHAYGMSQRHWYFFQAELPRDEARAAIGYFPSREDAKAWQRNGLHVVNVSGSAGDVPFPRVGVDDVAAGRLAAEHLLGLGLRHFVCVRSPSTTYGERRGNGFAGRLAEAGHACCDLLDELSHLSLDDLYALLGGPRHLGAWLASLPRPMGVFACTDAFASRVVDAARFNELRVPEDIAVIGADNDELICETKQPPLSSVYLPARRIGYIAAELLDRLLQGEPPPDQPVLLEPGPVVARQSTGAQAIPDPIVATAMRFIAEHAIEPITADDVIAAVPLSRRALEQRFADVIGSTPTVEIRHRRIEHAKRLLTMTDLSIDSIAALSGFTDHRHLSRTFARHVGRSPSAHRRGNVDIHQH